jgi:hypothetical protein
MQKSSRFIKFFKKIFFLLLLVFFSINRYSEDPTLYNGSNPLLTPGALLAVPLAQLASLQAALKTPPAQALAWTLAHYGGLLCDDTYVSEKNGMGGGGGGSKNRVDLMESPSVILHPFCFNFFVSFFFLHRYLPPFFLFLFFSFYCVKVCGSPDCERGAWFQ